MAGNFNKQVEGYTFWNPNGYWLGMYTVVALATAAEVATANAAGVQGNVGELCVICPVAGGLPTREPLGVAQNSAKVGQEVRVTTAGVSYVMVGAAVAEQSVLFAAVSETRTSAQTPFVDNNQMLIPVDPASVPTYALVLADDTALPGANTIHYPLGTALKPAVAKYNIIPVRLTLGYRR